jgi:hypothetical protein
MHMRADIVIAHNTRCSPETAGPIRRIMVRPPAEVYAPRMPTGAPDGPLLVVFASSEHQRVEREEVYIHGYRNS